ncbi:hypothetical protein Golob_024801 [Gossypium lobatum]|uniref:Uncharacterized protein n=1 Tax=Gossypium lobatum TaxID=34289 RepID=A0A7J8NIG3_9ROSI|nr:hypothetical protein [Gossypium lobatum]
MREILNTVMDDQAEKLTEKNDALEAMVTNLEEQITELKGEVIIYIVALAMAEVKTFFELGLKKDKFKSSKPKETGNGGGDYEEDKNGNGGNDNACNRKPPNWKRKSNNKPKGPVKCFLCDDLHMMRDCQMKYMFSTTEGDDEPTRASTK